MQPVSQLTLMAQAEQKHIQFGVGKEYDVASQHNFSEVRHTDRSRELDRLLRLELPHPVLASRNLAGRPLLGAKDSRPRALTISACSFSKRPGAEPASCSTMKPRAARKQASKFGAALTLALTGMLTGPA